ncbi:hypothetical protein ACFL6M_02920 [Candidatus Eisenbacteria bacterium]|uniref:Peptidase C-terminal archaeal/bacterial domain-containing protein n=1 Tax=Eiseniibacteriota bacterium TaxID=2212470 RepID=A0ABV6YJM2_UNCEI
MRALTFAVVLLSLFCGGVSHAGWDTISPVLPEKDDSHVTGVPVGGDRIDGDTIAEAWVVTSLPFTDTVLNTCTFNDDYDEVCPYTGSTSPDVVYAFAPDGDMLLVCDLCMSGYDTKIYIYEDLEGNLIACDDDGCGSPGYESFIYNVPLSAGHVYYIVVDGYGGDCGSYILNLTDGFHCYLECPDDAILEGEPICYDGYDDQFNSGCSTNIFQDVFPCDGEPITMCGTGGVYYFGSSLYRDTDWFQLVTSAPDVVSWTVESNLWFSFYFLDGTETCASIGFVGSHEAEPCVPYTFSNVQLSYPGTYWLWASASDWDLGMYPCDGTIYVWTLTGFTGQATPIEESTWGTIKSMFR